MARITKIAVQLCSTTALVLAAGCAKSDEPAARAETPIGELKVASAGMPSADMTYVSDQSQVKLVKAPDVSYEPLETFRNAKTAESDDASASAGDGAASSGGTGPFSKAKAALGSMLGGLMGGGAGGAAPPMPTGDDADASAEGDDADFEDDETVELVAMKDPLGELPAHPSNVTGEPIETAKAAAMAAARENLAKRIFAMKLNDEESIGEAIGADADPKSLELSASVMVGATWVNPNKLEVEIMCRLSDIVSELEQKHSSLDLNVIKAMEQDKAVAAKGIGDLKHENEPTRRARPGNMARDAAEGGGGI